MVVLLLQSINREERNDPADYRDICVSSCLGKLFRSILNQRLLEHIMSLNTPHLHKSQIGFLPNNRTADHVFAPRTLIDKYVHNHKKKMYACFVGFKKVLTRSGMSGSCISYRKLLLVGVFTTWLKALIYYSFKICPRFWLAKSTRIVHQLFWMNNKTIIEFGFCIIWRITRSQKGVIRRIH